MPRYLAPWLAALTACSGHPGGGTPDGASGDDGGGSEIGDAAPAADARAPIHYQNPVLDQSCPDPGVLFDEERASFHAKLPNS